MTPTLMEKAPRNIDPNENELANTPNANMADHSVGARDESHESEVSQALMFCFDNAFPEKSCFVVDLVPLFRPLYPFLCS